MVVLEELPFFSRKGHEVHNFKRKEKGHIVIMHMIIRTTPQLQIYGICTYHNNSQVSIPRH
jgi:hypothetical protein